MGDPEAPNVLHADADAFFASVAQRDDPELRGRPTAVGSWVVMAASYEARAFGVRGGMRAAEARRLCPGLRFAEHDFDAYTRASRELFSVFRLFSPVVEGLSLEEAFLDVRGLGHVLGSPGQIAADLRREVGRRVGLPITVGVASSKVVAKMASRAAKPDGLKLVEPGDEADFLRPLPVEDLWGVGPSTARKLQAERILTVGQLAARPLPQLVAILGNHQGRHLHAVANGRDRRRVRSGRRRGSFGTQSALDGRPRSAEELDARLVALVDRVTSRMRKANRAGRTVVLRLRHRDYAKVSRSVTLHRSTATTRTVLVAARRLLADAMPQIERRGITLIGVAVSNLDATPGIQLELPLEPPHRPAADLAIDEIRERFGKDTLSRAAALERGPRRSAGPSLDPESP